MADAVKAVAPDALLEPLIGTGVKRGPSRQLAVEGGIENGYLGSAGEEAFAGLDAFQIGGIVQWRKGGEALDRCLHLRRDQHALSIIRAAVDNTVPDHSNIRRPVNDARFAAPERLQHPLDDYRARLPGNLLFYRRAARRFDFEVRRVFLLRPIGVGLPQRLRCLVGYALANFIEPAFLAAGSCVQDKYFHWRLPITKRNNQNRQCRDVVGARRRLGGARGRWGPKRKPAPLCRHWMREVGMKSGLASSPHRPTQPPSQRRAPTSSHQPFPLPILVVNLHNAI